MTVILRAMRFPGTALISGEARVGDVCSQRPERHVDRGVLAPVWSLIVDVVPRDLPVADELVVIGRDTGREQLVMMTTIHSARQDDRIAALVDALIAAARTSHPELAAQAVSIWNDRRGGKM